MHTIPELLVRQDLVISRSQALRRGMTEHAWDWRLKRGRWQRAVDGVAVAHTGELSPVQRAWCSVLHAGRDAALSGDAALHLIRFPVDPPSVIDAAVPHGRKAVNAAFADGTTIRIRRISSLENLRDSKSTLPSVSRHVAVLHAGAWAASDRACEWRIAAMVQRRLSAVPRLREALDLLPRLPRRALIRTVLDDIQLGAHAGSELAFLRFLRQHGLPLPDGMQVKVRTGGRTSYLDARYDKQRTTVEVDGAHHRDVESWDADALRTLRLVAGLPGDRLVRITMGNIRHDGPELAGLLRSLLSCG